MDTVERQELLALVEELSRRYPEMRIGQLIAFSAFLAQGPIQSAVWDVEDDDLKRAIEEHLRKQKGEY